MVSFFYSISTILAILFNPYKSVLTLNILALQVPCRPGGCPPKYMARPIWAKTRPNGRVGRQRSIPTTHCVCSATDAPAYVRGCCGAGSCFVQTAVAGVQHRFFFLWLFASDTKSYRVKSSSDCSRAGCCKWPDWVLLRMAAISPVIGRLAASIARPRIVSASTL